MDGAPRQSARPTTDWSEIERSCQAIASDWNARPILELAGYKAVMRLQAYAHAAARRQAEEARA